MHPRHHGNPHIGYLVASVFAIIVVVLPGTVAATDYYVSPTGSNSNTGTSLSSPFLTIQTAASKVQAGDNVYVRGGTYRETVTVIKSGTTAAPITFQPYRNENVTITGLDLANGGWSAYSGSTYQKTLSANATQLFVNGKMMSEARSSNSSYVNPLRRTYNTVALATIQTSPTASTIVSNNLGSPSDGKWNGAKMAILSGSAWVTNKATITAQTGNTLNFQWPDGNPSGSYYTPKAGNRFYLYGTAAAVDATKEYYYDSANSRLYLNHALDPNSQTVEVRNRELGFKLGYYSSNIKVSGFRLKAANLSLGGTNNVVDHCQILYPTPFTDTSGFAVTNGVTIAGQNNTLSNSEIAYSWGSGVTVASSYSNNTVKNNLVHDVDWYGNDSAAIDIGGSKNTAVMNNTMYNAGRSGLMHRNATAATLTHNEIARYGFLTEDLGGTSAYQTDGSGTVIAYNNIHDCLSKVTTGTGIYLDNGCSNFTVHHNLVNKAMIGVVLNNPSTNNNVYNNTLWGTTQYAMNAHGDGSLTNCKTYNNLCNRSEFIGTSLGTNLATTTNQFVNSAAGNFQLASTSSAINAGTAISGITDGYVGPGPDIGAFEYGTDAWTAGAGFKTWLAGDQVAGALTSAVAVTQSNVRTTAGSLVAGKTSTSDSTLTRSFLKFDLSGVTGNIQSAVLRLYENTAPSSTNGGVNVYQVTSDWDASSVQFSQAVNSSGIAFYDPDNLDLYTDIDVTSIVQGWVSGTSSNYGFSLQSDSESTSNSAKYFEGMFGVTTPQLIISVPEPGTCGLLFTSVLALAGYAWRKRKSGRWLEVPSSSGNGEGIAEVLYGLKICNLRHGRAARGVQC